MTTEEKELWAKVINDARWYDGTPQMLQQLTEHFNKQGITVKNCSMPNVVGRSEQLPTLIEIDFDGHLKCQLETTDVKPKILKAVNGYGQPVDCRDGNIRINDL